MTGKNQKNEFYCNSTKLIIKGIGAIALLFIIPVFFRVIADSLYSENLIIVSVPVYIILYRVLYKAKNSKKIFCYCFCAMILIQIAAGYLLMVEYSTWDVYAVTKNARALVTGGYFNTSYFAKYPNNIALLLLFKNIFEITNYLFGSTSNWFLVVLNIVAIDIAVIFMIKTLKMVYCDNVAYKPGIVACFFSPLYLYSPICYTDTLSMPIVMVVVFICVYLLQNYSGMSTVKRIFCCISLGSVIMLGFKFKGSIIIMLIAVLMVCFLKFDFRSFLKIIALIIVGFVVTYGIWTIYVKSTNLITEEDYNKYRMPTTHWIMMGMKGKGNFDSDSVNFTMSFDTYDQKKTATIDKIKENYQIMGIKGVIKQGYNKAATYGWNYGTCYAERYLGDTGDVPLNNNFLHKFVLTKGEYHRFYYVFTQGLWVLLLLLAMSDYIICINDNCIEKLFFRLLLVGCMMFFMIWETHPRYILNFTLMLLMISVPRMDGIINRISGKKEKC